MIALLYATPMESAPMETELLRLASAVDKRGDSITVYNLNKSPVALVIVGIGKPSAGFGTKRAIEQLAPRRLYNLGIAGGLSDDIEVHHIFRVDQAVDGSPTPPANGDRRFILDADQFDYLPARTLVTVDAPVFDDRLRKQLQQIGDMVDMEGAAIAQVAQKHKIPLTSLKIISDLAKAGHRETLRKNIHDASKKLAGLVAQTCFQG